MSGPIEEMSSESLTAKIKAKVNHHHNESTSSSDSENDNPFAKKFRLFGRKKPIHSALGGGKSADIILWRNKQISAAILVGATVVWVIFEWLGYHLLTFVCQALAFALVILFCWSHVSNAINRYNPWIYFPQMFMEKIALYFLKTRSMPELPEVAVPEDLFVSIALSLRYEINRAFSTLRAIASGRDTKKFLTVVVSLWILSIVGSWFNFLTLSYLLYVILHTVPFLYEMHEDAVDTFAERAAVEINKQYKVLDAKVLQKIPRGPFTDKKLR